MCGRIEAKGHVAARFVGLDRARQQPVERERLVVTARHEAFDHVTAEVLHGETFDDERIKAVEGAKHALHQPAALRGIGVGIRKFDKIVRHRRRAVHGDGVSGFRRCLRFAGEDRASGAQSGPHNRRR